MMHGFHLGGAALTAIALGMPFADSICGAVFQYSVPVSTSDGTRESFLWIPARAECVRGVVMAGMTLMEREFVKDPVIREACAEEQLAIAFLNCGLSSADLQSVLDRLADVSGYAEISAAPLFFVGHSAGGPQAKERAIQFAARCFGLVLYRGGVPGGTNPVPPGIPVLVMLGQFDEFAGTMRSETGRESWEGGRDALSAFRAAGERNLGSLVVEPGAGHFAWSERNAEYLAMFLRKAARARIPRGWPEERLGQERRSEERLAPPALLEIDPASGWLTDLSIRTPGEFRPAPFAEYSGPKASAAWHFDREMAEATVAYHASGFGKKDQFIQWTDPTWVDAGVRFFFTKISWVDDGQTFEVHPVYADRYPDRCEGKGSRWAEAGRPVGHSSAPILVKPVGGPFVAAGANRLRIQFDALAPATEPGRAAFVVYSMGDAEYRYAEQVGMLPRGFRGFRSGEPQQLTFEPLPRLKPDSPHVRLKATSSAGLPVEFYVAYGPATVTDGSLRVAEVPVRARFPIGVKVVAYQFGRGVEPFVQTAVPIEQSTQIEGP